MSLHEEGTYANGSWNLSSYAETGNELWSDQSESDESQSDGTYGSTSTRRMAKVCAHSERRRDPLLFF